MINAVIVTVKIAGAGQQHDMELPADIPIKELAPKLLMALKNIEGRLFMGVERIKIRFDAENRYLLDIETLASVGVWDGSIITVERGM
jgi:uncharacterized ubiquitin-like protein YukD